MDRFEAAVEAVPYGLLAVGADGIVFLVNREAERLFGKGRKALFGQRFETLMPDFAGAQTSAGPVGSRSVMELGVLGANLETWLPREGRVAIPVKIRFTPMGESDGQATLVIVSDITMRKLAEDALKAKSRDLERSNADLEQFAYVASHDLQEPLRMVASYTQLLSDKYKGQLDDQADRYIGYAVDGARRMQTLVRDLLSYSRVTASPQSPQQVDTQALVVDVLSAMESTVSAAEAVVIAEDLPIVIADAAQLRHLFLNLIGNALKFRQVASPRVMIRSMMAGGMACFVVEDNGIGIDQRHFARVFQMFQQLNERDKYQGSGIGLAIVKKIIERHGGRVWIESEVGKGTRVNFTLPVPISV
jgi:PAS domain S-box-containing protein